MYSYSNCDDNNEKVNLNNENTTFEINSRPEHIRYSAEPISKIGNSNEPQSISSKLNQAKNSEGENNE